MIETISICRKPPEDAAPSCSAVSPSLTTELLRGEPRISVATQVCCQCALTGAPSVLPS